MQLAGASWRHQRRSPDAPSRKTYCFSEVVDAEWRGGTIHAQLSVFPRPGGPTEDWAAPPDLKFEAKREIHRSDREARVGVRGALITVTPTELLPSKRPEPFEDCFLIRAGDGVVVTSVDLLDESGRLPRPLGARPDAGGHMMFERLRSYDAADRPFRVDIHLRLTFQPPKKPAPVVRSFWDDFLAGGRPESNRRKF